MERLEFSESKVAIVTIFPEDEVLRPDIYQLTEMLNFNGFKVLIVSNKVMACEIPLGTVFLTRENRGFDLSAIRDVLQILEFDSIQELLVLNDSVYWNAEKFFLTLKNLEAKSNGVWSFVESLQGGKHMQSFFFYLSDDSNQKLLFKGFMEVFSKVRNSTRKRHIVWYGEKMIYKRLKTLGVETQPVFKYGNLTDNYLENYFFDPELIDRNDIRKLISKGIPLNPSIHLCESLLRMNAPFIKRSILSKNPAHFTTPYTSYLVEKFSRND